MKDFLLKKVARISEYTAEEGYGWPTYWGFHEIEPNDSAKNVLEKKKNDKKNSK